MPEWIGNIDPYLALAIVFYFIIRDVLKSRNGKSVSPELCEERSGGIKEKQDELKEQLRDYHDEVINGLGKKIATEVNQQLIERIVIHDNTVRQGD